MPFFTDSDFKTLILFIHRKAAEYVCGSITSQIYLLFFADKLKKLGTYTHTMTIYAGKHFIIKVYPYSLVKIDIVNFLRSNAQFQRQGDLLLVPQVINKNISRMQ